MTPVWHGVNDIEVILPARLRSNPGTVSRIKNAWLFAERAHAGQRRRSGEPYTEHLYATAERLCALNMGTETVMAGILHDVLEDTVVTNSELEKTFGKIIAFLVAGVTKLKKGDCHDSDDAHQETLRRILLAAARDPRILIIKLCDRLHNMQTLQYLSAEKQRRVAIETLEIYVPVADRLGMNIIKRELEDLSFRYAYPKIYVESEREFKTQFAKRYQPMMEAMGALKTHLVPRHIESARFVCRTKGRYSFYKKFERKQKNADVIHDVVTLQTILPTVADCYETLGLVHALWRPISGKTKDYIAFPKPNGYQCLRTTVNTGTFGVVEVQMYSEDMYECAQNGYAVKLALLEREDSYFMTKHLEKWFSNMLNWVRHIPSRVAVAGSTKGERQPV